VHNAHRRATEMQTHGAKIQFILDTSINMARTLSPSSLHYAKRFTHIKIKIQLLQEETKVIKVAMNTVQFLHECDEISPAPPGPPLMNFRQYFNSLISDSEPSETSSEDNEAPSVRLATTVVSPESNTPSSPMYSPTSD
jgi:hypothetical protein